MYILPELVATQNLSPEIFHEASKFALNSSNTPNYGINSFFLVSFPYCQMIAPLSVEALKRRLVSGCQSNELIILKCSFNVHILIHKEISGLP
jgi:hypothetical protein